MLKFITILFCLAAFVRAHHDDDKSNYKKVNGEVTMKLLQTLTEDDNALFSPILLTNSLLTLTNAASGDVRTELLKALNIKTEGKFLKILIQNSRIQLDFLFVFCLVFVKQRILNTSTWMQNIFLIFANIFWNLKLKVIKP